MGLIGGTASVIFRKSSSGSDLALASSNSPESCSDSSTTTPGYKCTYKRRKRPPPEPRHQKTVLALHHSGWPPILRLTCWVCAVPTCQLWPERERARAHHIGETDRYRARIQGGTWSWRAAFRQSHPLTRPLPSPAAPAGCWTGGGWGWGGGRGFGV